MSTFKLGDWVISTKYPKANPIKIQHQHAIDTGVLGTYANSKGQASLLYAEECKLWQPKVGEWCWFYKEQVKLEYVGTHWAIPYLGRFGKFTEQGVQTIEKFCYSFCEPFIGQLPTFIKDQS